jgi:hypothetical protein
MAVLREVWPTELEYDKARFFGGGLYFPPPPSDRDPDQVVVDGWVAYLFDQGAAGVNRNYSSSEQRQVSELPNCALP